jgi:hypothetical protein
MTVWEYHKTSGDGELEALGQEGWELVAVVPSMNDGEATFYFKRPAHDFRERVTLDQKRHYYGLMGITPREEGHTK